MTTNLFLGFDPGGKNAFGWCVCKEVGDGLERLAFDLADHAEDAVTQVNRAIESCSNVRIPAAGIDAPLLVHRRKGNRSIDQNLRDALTRKRFPGSVSGTVQEVNSLRGAATLQGGLLVMQLVGMPWAHDTKITESHPTAFRYLLSHAGQDNLVKTANCLTKDLITCTRTHKSKKEEDDCTTCEQDSHKVDATLCAIAAWAATKSSSKSNWCDLYKRANALIPLFQLPESTRLSYWMPMPR